MAWCAVRKMRKSTDKKDFKVAIKRIGNTFRDLTDAKRILREMKLMRHLGGHANVVSIIDIFVIPFTARDFRDVYIVTKMFESDLAKIIGSKQELSAAHAKYFTYQILRGLKYIKSAKVIHRDLKPANLLVNANCELAIADFGLARGVHHENDEYDVGLTGYVVTRWYRAPELLLGDRYGFGIDIWSVGCILAEILSRSVLFPGRSYIHQLRVIVETLGTPSEEQLSFIKVAGARGSIAAMPRFPGKTMRELFPKADLEAVSLLSQLLEFDPRRRISVEDALSHPWLSEYHDKAREPVCKKNFDFSFEGDGSVIPKEKLQALMMEEIQSHHRTIPRSGRALNPPAPQQRARLAPSPAEPRQPTEAEGEAKSAAAGCRKRFGDSTIADLIRFIADLDKKASVRQNAVMERLTGIESRLAAVENQLASINLGSRSEDARRAAVARTPEAKILSKKV